MGRGVWEWIGGEGKGRELKRRQGKEREDDANSETGQAIPKTINPARKVIITSGSLYRVAPFFGRCGGNCYRVHKHIQGPGAPVAFLLCDDLHHSGLGG